ncbi:hypothetical protein, partial [Malonomonas rubra]|uniref:hypothetical protein n=1 Tax=Malonomonas rubra TaxID=57040 RepID=UPI0026EB75D9
RSRSANSSVVMYVCFSIFSSFLVIYGQYTTIVCARQAQMCSQKTPVRLDDNSRSFWYIPATWEARQKR